MLTGASQIAGGEAAPEQGERFRIVHRPWAEFSGDAESPYAIEHNHPLIGVWRHMRQFETESQARQYLAAYLAGPVVVAETELPPELPVAVGDLQLGGDQPQGNGDVQ